MAYTPRNRDLDDRYAFPQDHPTISKLVRPSNDVHTVDRQNINNPYTTTRRQDDDRYPTDFGRTKDSAYESIRRSNDGQYPTQRYTGADNRQEIDRRTNNFEYTRRVPTADIIVDPPRRSAHGNGRTCVMEINIELGMGGNRTSQASSFTTNNASSKSPAIRSATTIDNVRYIELNFQAPENTATLATDGIIRRSPSQNSTGFPNEYARQ